MVSPEQDNPVQEHLTKLANVTGNAVLVLNRGIDGACFNGVRSSLNKIGEPEVLSVVLNSDGGSIEFAFRIAKAIRASCDKLEVLVPARAKSAATLIALAADQIRFGEFGELGPLDPQVPDFTGSADYRSPLEIVKGLEFLRNYYVETFDVMVLFLLEQAGMDVAHTMENATGALSPIAESLYRSVNYRELGEAVRNLAISQRYAVETMRRWSPLPKEITEAIVETLVWEYPHHGHIIDVEEAHQIGLSNVECLDPTVESLCLEIIALQGPFIESALPGSDNQGGEDNESVLTSGGENETEYGSPCEQ